MIGSSGVELVLTASSEHQRGRVVKEAGTRGKGSEKKRKRVRAERESLRVGLYSYIPARCRLVETAAAIRKVKREREVILYKL